MLDLIAVEFLKLRRNKIILLILISTLVMPVMGLIYYSGTDVTTIQFLKWTVYSYTSWLILPIVLGIFSTMLVFEEKQNDILKQLYIIPVHFMKLFAGKFVLVLLLAVVYMMVTLCLSYLLGTVSGLIVINPGDIPPVLVKCIQIPALTSLAIIPIQCMAFIFDSYIFPVCGAILYTFMGFIMMMVNMYVHPLSSATAIWMKDVPGVALNQKFSYPASLICIGVWCMAFIYIMIFILNKRK